MYKEARIILTVSFLLLITLQGRVDAFNKDNKEVIINEGIKTYKVQTKANTVEELLQTTNILLEEHDYMDKNLDYIFLNNEKNEITIKKGIKVKIIKNEKEEDFWALEGSVPEDIVEEIYKETGKTYIYDEDIKDTCIEKDQIIKLYNLEKKQISEVKNIPFNTEVVYNNNLLKDKEQILNRGKEGKKNTIVELELLDGTEIKRNILEEEIIKKPVNCTKEIGTKKLNYYTNRSLDSNIVIMNASAYSAKQPNLSRKTATGQLAIKGVVAVDPRFIPLGTKLYIEGYGYAVAADIGGAIKGNKIDLCYDTVEEALKFGRKNIKVHILK